MTFTLAIVGRPNVGKSTLFNRLVGKKLALVDDQPGVTRDLREGEARLGPLRFTVIDSAGLEEAADESLQGRMRKLTERAVEMADACLFVVDARAGVLPADEVFADILRRKNAHVILAANKAEGTARRGRADRRLVARPRRTAAAVGRARRGHGRAGGGADADRRGRGGEGGDCCGRAAGDRRGAGRGGRRGRRKRRPTGRRPPRGRSRSPWSAGRMPASRRWSTR